jgi:hypothetical protein
MKTDVPAYCRELELEQIFSRSLWNEQLSLLGTISRIGNSTLLHLFIHRETTLVVYIMTLVGMVVYTFTLNLNHLWVVFITAGTLG